MRFISCRVGHDSLVRIMIIIVGLSSVMPVTRVGVSIRVCAVVLTVLIASVGPECTLKLDRSRLMIIACMGLAMLVSVSYGIVQFEFINSNLVVHEISRFGYIALILFMLSQTEIEIGTVHLMILIIAFFTIFIGFIQYFYPDVANDFIMKYYVEGDEMPIHMQISYYRDKRIGSLFINPNIGGAAIVLCMPYFIHYFIEKKRLLDGFMVVLSVVFIVMTGSRTSLAIGLAIIGYTMIVERRSFWLKVSIVIVLAALFCFVFYSLFYDVGGIRILKFGSGIREGGSLRIKIQILDEYIRDSNFFSLFFGSITDLGFEGADSEWVYVFSLFGLFGLCWYIILLKQIWTNYCIPKLIRHMYVIIIALAGLTESIIFCMPILPMTLVASLCRQRKHDWRNSNENIGMCYGCSKRL